MGGGRGQDDRGNKRRGTLRTKADPSSAGLDPQGHREGLSW